MERTVLKNFEQELINEIEYAGKLIFFPANATMIKQGRYLKETLLIIQGSIKVTKENKQGDEFVVAYIKPGDSLAVSISDDSPEKNKISLLSFTAIEPVKAIALSFAEKDRLALKYTSFFKYILQAASMYHEFYLEVIDHFAFRNMDSRITYFLKRLSEVKQSTVLTITHQEIADGLNTSREVVSRILKKMEEAGQIHMSAKSIQIISLL